MSTRMSASSVVFAVTSRQAGRMSDLLLGAAILAALILLDLLAMRFGVDTRRDESSVWW